MASLLLAAAIAAAQPWQPQSGATAQATATVRIVAGQRVEFSVDATGQSAAQPKARRTKLELDGSEVPALLVEFS